MNIGLHCDLCPKSVINLKVKFTPQQAEVAQGVPGRLRPRIFLTFGTTRVVGRQPYARAAFTPGEIPATHFQRLSRPQGTWFRRWEPRKKSQVTPPGIDPGTVRLVAQCVINLANTIMKFNTVVFFRPSLCHTSYISLYLFSYIL